MDERIQRELKRLDVNGDGKIDAADAQRLLADELAKVKPVKVAGGAFIAGLVVGFIAGRASK